MKSNQPQNALEQDLEKCEVLLQSLKQKRSESTDFLSENHLTELQDIDEVINYVAEKLQHIKNSIKEMKANAIKGDTSCLDYQRLEGMA